MSETALMKRPTLEEFETEFRDLLERKGKIELIESDGIARTVPQKLFLGSVLIAGGIGVTTAVFSTVTLGLVIVASLWGVGSSFAINAIMNRLMKNDLKALPPAPSGYSDALAERASALRSWLAGTYVGAPLSDEDLLKLEELENLRLDFDAAREADRLSQSDVSNLIHADGEDFDQLLLEAQKSSVK